MPIGPRGERLPYNRPPPGMGGGRGPDLPPAIPGAQAVQEFEATRGGGVPGGDVDSLAAELMQITQRAEQIISQLEAQGVNPEQLLAGGGQQVPAPVGGVGVMPQMPVAGNTGLPMPGLIA